MGHIRAGEPSFQLADEYSLGKFQGGSSSFASYGREIIQKFIECISALQVVEKGLERNAGAPKNGRAPENLRSLTMTPSLPCISSSI